MEDIKSRFEKCIQFFSDLSKENSVQNLSPINAKNNSKRWNPVGKTPMKEDQMKEKSTCVQKTEQIDSTTQTKAGTGCRVCQTECGDFFHENQFSFIELVENEIQNIQSLINKTLPNTHTEIPNDGDSSENTVTATATTVVSAEDAALNRFVTYNSTAHSNDSKISSWLASSKSICLGLLACERELNDLLPDKQEVLIHLATSCLLKRKNVNESDISAVSNQSNFVNTGSLIENSVSILHSLPHLTHISDSYTSSSEESFHEKSNIFVATPVSMATAIAELSNNSNIIKETTNTKTVTENNISKPCRTNSALKISDSISETFTNNQKILSDIFYKTSTPLYESHLNRNTRTFSTFSPS